MSLSVLSSLLVCQLYGAQLLDEYIIPFTLSCIIHHVSILGTDVCSLSFSLGFIFQLGHRWR